MRTTTPEPNGRSVRLGLALTLGTCLLGGCLGEPKIEDRWTRIDITGSSLAQHQALPAGSAQTVNVSTAITYRSIITGFAVAELRASGTLTPADVPLAPDGARVRMAQDIDRLLANSVTMGRATRAITGWDHLIQRIDFTFTGVSPAALDTTGGASGTPTGLFLVCYLGAGEEIRRQNAPDTLIITPFRSDQYEILPVGMTLASAPPGPLP